jgi:hypothetical protein
MSTNDTTLTGKDFINFGIGVAVTFVITLCAWFANTTRKINAKGETEIGHRTIKNVMLLPILLGIGIIFSYYFGVTSESQIAVWNNIRFPVSFAGVCLITHYVYKYVGKTPLGAKITAGVFIFGLMLICLFCMDKYKSIAYLLAAPTPCFGFPWARVYIWNFDSLLWGFIPCYDAVQIYNNKLSPSEGWNKKFTPLG